MKCISGAVNGVSVEDFGKVTVVIFKKTHYNRECPNQIGHSFSCDRKFLSHKMLRKDRTAAVRKYVAGFFFMK